MAKVAKLLLENREIGVALFLFPELPGMDNPARSVVFNRVLDVQHLVIHHVTHQIVPRLAAIQKAGEDNRMVRGVVMSEHPVRGVPFQPIAGTSRELPKKAPFSSLKISSRSK